MHLTRRMLIQLAVFAVIALTAIAVMGLHFLKLPAKWFGVGRYSVTMQLPETGGLYNTGNVTYRGVEVGRVQSVRLSDSGVDAVLSLKSGIDIPSDLRGEVHSQSAIGEQYVDLIPRDGTARPLRDGDVIPRDHTSVPPDINALLDAANSGLQAIPRENLKTAIDEAYTAVGGLGPQLSDIVKGSTTLAIDARANLDPLINLIDNAKPVLDSQVQTSAAIRAWASHIATVTGELKANNDAVAGVIDQGGLVATNEQARNLIERLKPTLPVIVANLSSIGQVAVTYQNDIEQLLVLLPHAVSEGQATFMANANTNQAYRGEYLSFNLNINLPPACTTGFLPAQQQRIPNLVDYPERPPGDLYCRTPQDSPFNVRGARNIPCETVPGKRAPTVKLCQSEQNYVPLNEGYNWKGDPNATLSGQPVPDVPPEGPPTDVPPPALVAVSGYDPATGTYVGPNGREYTQSELAEPAKQNSTWQSMLLPGQP
ncbi:MCE family protein [Mycolicibacterium aichiense]|uniref:Mammalian cell entry protein n=1 Tax=Mycolicibacterium aichiense TaxID=1799 RepID=A0AAD1HM71_9MYCO|nr:MlaD family protein [Mycolicibacterium aichiense]MCV7017623.1 MCE family protein [Mycolicibacterium aichiense]BBX06773.1 mammalian cell entry protein [Mycolicibacterium aichiense]STZ80589.1 virulence factor Mce family protein [Mycolicibacterium aichiense]